MFRSSEDIPDIGPDRYAVKSPLLLMLTVNGNYVVGHYYHALRQWRSSVMEVDVSKWCYISDVSKPKISIGAVTILDNGDNTTVTIAYNNTAVTVCANRLVSLLEPLTTKGAVTDAQPK